MCVGVGVLCIPYNDKVSKCQINEAIQNVSNEMIAPNNKHLFHLIHCILFLGRERKN